jgi:hypothetical protein
MGLYAFRVDNFNCVEINLTTIVNVRGNLLQISIPWKQANRSNRFKKESADRKKLGAHKN